MKKIIMIFNFFIFLRYCTYEQNVTGRYYSRHKEKGVVHYVELFPDSTFLHLYENANIRQEDRGSWHLCEFDNGDSKYIIFSNWKDFGYSMKYSTYTNVNDVTLMYGQLFFDLDDYDLNFMKE